MRISLTGPEAVGKSTLAAQLAKHFGTVFVPEYAREYLTENGPTYTLADLENIARAQIIEEDQGAGKGNGLLFCDTDLLVIKVWAENAFNTCPPWVEAALRRPRYALTLLLAPDLPWHPDPLREHPNPADRWRFHARYRQLLQELNWPFIEIAGPAETRLPRAVAAVLKLTQAPPNPVPTIQQ